MDTASDPRHFVQPFDTEAAIARNLALIAQHDAAIQYAALNGTLLVD